MARCPSTYPGGVTLAGRPVACDDPRGKGHDGDHGNSFAARWWTDDDGPRGWGTPDRGVCGLPADAVPCLIAAGSPACSPACRYRTDQEA